MDIMNLLLLAAAATCVSAVWIRVEENVGTDNCQEMLRNLEVIIKLLFWAVNRTCFV